MIRCQQIWTKVWLPSDLVGRRPRPASIERRNLRPVDPVGWIAIWVFVVCQRTRNCGIASRPRRRRSTKVKPLQLPPLQRCQSTNWVTKFGCWRLAMADPPRCLIGRHHPAVHLRGKLPMQTQRRKSAFNIYNPRLRNCNSTVSFSKELNISM